MSAKQPSFGDRARPLSEEARVVSVAFGRQMRPVSDDLHALGQTIHRFRTQKGVTAAELAQTIGVADPRLRAIEAGVEDPGFKLLRRIARALNVPPRVLLYAEALEAQDR